MSVRAGATGQIRPFNCENEVILNQFVRSLIHVTDWLPTLYAAAGGDLADLPEGIDGVNQWPSLADAREPSKSNRQGGNKLIKWIITKSTNDLNQRTEYS